MCRTCASFCHTSYMRNMHATCVCDMRCLHTCMLQVCCTSVLHKCMLLQCCIHTASHDIHLSINPMYLNVAVLLINECQSYSFYTRRFISGINIKFSCVLHTQKLKHATYKHMRCAEYMHAQYSIHTAYISATFMHILGMYTAYILHMCTPAHVTHVCCTRAAHTIHPYCMHAAYTKIGSAPHAYHTNVCSLCAIVYMQHVCCT